MIDLVWLIPLLPLLGFLTIILFNKILNKTLIGVIGSGTILGAFIIVLTILFPLLSNTLDPEQKLYFQYTWIKAANIDIGFSFLIDRLSVLMMSIITGVGFLIHLYSIGYMKTDEGFHRYFAFLNLFVFFMLILVMASNYVLMFAGWEGVGLCSYLLIGFWFKNHDFNNAAKKAFIMNRVGDLGFLLGIILIFQQFNSFDFATVFGSLTNGGDASALQPNAPVLIAITLLLFVGATGKSAQIPLYTWLPDAMAGPTPVSALIHAATMVTAGVYMIVRSSVLFEFADFTMDVIMVIGLATTLFAATIALVQNDIKKVLAYSTVSQLGYMFFALGLGAYSAGMFHLTTHAFFKALLFLGAGSVIHAMSNDQDIRNMGGLRKKMPITFITFLIAALAISGVPPFAGFFSKDEIFSHAWAESPLLWVLAVAGALMTTFYMFRVLFLTFFGEFRGTETQKSHLHESPSVMTIPLIVLAILSAIGGFIGVPEVLGGSNALKGFLDPVIFGSEATQHKVSHSTEWVLMAISAIAVLVVILITWFIYIRKSSRPVAEGQATSAPHKLLSNKYYIDEIYRGIFITPVYWLSKNVYSFIELKIIDNLVNSSGKGVKSGSAGLRFIQNGNISFYLFAIVIGIILVLAMNELVPLIMMGE